MISLDDYLKTIPKIYIKDFDKFKLGVNKIAKKYTRNIKQSSDLYSHYVFTWFLIEDYNIKALDWMLKNGFLAKDDKLNDYVRGEFDYNPRIDVIKLFIKYNMFEWSTMWLLLSAKNDKLFDLVWKHTKKLICEEVKNSKNKEKLKKEIYTELYEDVFEEIDQKYLKHLKNFKCIQPK